MILNKIIKILAPTLAPYLLIATAILRGAVMEEDHTNINHDEETIAAPTFVVQKHDARKLHYDFRIEMNGVLKSWAIPKSPSTDPKEKRLAILVEDHPISYANFEGEIPKGHYGAGKVEIWDSGTFSNLKNDSLEECLKNGRLEINLEGKKLKGAFALIRFEKAGKDDWIFKKVSNKSKK